ncbi:MAG: hypothetical protein QME64_10200 [bacterium]|nr:hypothetical protein [bacterium]
MKQTVRLSLRALAKQSRFDSRLRGNDVIPAKAGIASSLRSSQ